MSADKLITIEKITSITPRTDTQNPMDIVEIESGAKNIANRDDPEQSRDKVGDYVIVIPSDRVISEKLLKHNDLWNEEKGKGMLKGSKGNRTGVRNIAGMPSEVMLVRINKRPEADEQGRDVFTLEFDGNLNEFTRDDDIAGVLGVTEYVNPNG